MTGLGSSGEGTPASHGDVLGPRRFDSTLSAEFRGLHHGSPHATEPRTRSKCSLRVSPHGGQQDQQCLCRGFYHFWQEPYAGLSQFDDAWRCIGDAMTAVETTKEKWSVAEVHRVAGEIALLSQEPGCRAKAETYFERALGVARKQQAKSWELRAATCRSDDDFKSTPVANRQPEGSEIRSGAGAKKASFVALFNRGSVAHFQFIGTQVGACMRCSLRDQTASASRPQRSTTGASARPRTSKPPNRYIVGRMTCASRVSGTHGCPKR